MHKVLLGIIGNGRSELLDQTITSLEETVDYPFFKKIIVDDTGSLSYAVELERKYGDKFHILAHTDNKGLSGSIRTLWEAAQMLDVDYVFHVEEDFTFNVKPPIDNMITILKASPHVWQVALKRQPVNGDEAAVGGFMQQDPTAYTQFYLANDPNIYWVEHRRLFTLNPCIYSIDITRPLWPQSGGEREFSDRVFLNEESTCAFLGGIEDEPMVNHIGNYRAPGWKL